MCVTIIIYSSQNNENLTVILYESASLRKATKNLKNQQNSKHYLFMHELYALFEIIFFCLLGNISCETRFNQWDYIEYFYSAQDW